MANLQWLPGMQYAYILISTSDTYNTEHQTHIYHYRKYLSVNVLAFRNYDYIRHTKHEMIVDTPNITYSQYLELRERFLFCDTSFATMDLSELTELPEFYNKEIQQYLSNKEYDLYGKVYLDNKDEAHFIPFNPTYKLDMTKLDQINNWELNPQIKPETIFEDVKYDHEGWVISVGKKKMNVDMFHFRNNPNFYCFDKNPTLLDIQNNQVNLSLLFAENPANKTYDCLLEYAPSNRIISQLIQDVVNVTDFAIKPKKPDAIYQAIMNGGIDIEYYEAILNHIIEDHHVHNYLVREPLTKYKIQIYLHTHFDPVKYDIDRL